jgi:hypothetical protein
MKKQRNPFAPRAYSLLDEITASEKHAMPEDIRIAHMNCIRQALYNLENAERPVPNDWRCVSDAVNFMETFIREMQLCADPGDLLNDAVTALAHAGQRHIEQGKPIRLDGPGIAAVRAIVADYAEILQQVPHRVAIRCHRKTETRVRKVLHGVKQKHDVTLIAI